MSRSLIGPALAVLWLVLCPNLDGTLPPAQSNGTSEEVILARESRLSGDLNGAIERLHRVIESEPRFAEAQTELGMCYWNLNRLEDAQVCFERAIELDPEPLIPYMNLAEVLSERNEPAKAQNVLDWAGRLHPERGEPLYVQAKIQFRAGRLGSAEESATRALERDTSRIPEVHMLLANIFLAQGKQDERVKQLEAYLAEAAEGEQAERARATLEQVRREIERNAAPSTTSYWDLVDRYKEGGFTEAATALSGLSRRTIQEACDTNNSRQVTDSQLIAAGLLHTETALVIGNESSFHFRRAVDYLARIKDDERRQPVERQWFLAMGYYYLGKYRFMVALPFLVDAMTRFPDDLEIRLALGSAGEGAGMIRGSSNELRQAEIQFRHILERDAGHVEARLRLGHVLEMEGKDEEALRQLTWTLDYTARKDVLLLANLLVGDIQKKRGRLGPAIDSYRSAVACDPGCQAAATALSHALHLAGDIVGSGEVLKSFLEQRGRSQGGVDTLWRYLRGRADQFDVLMRQIREEMVR
jgi:tetratricopeptide (TPR) repeat protein